MNPIRRAWEWLTDVYPISMLVVIGVGFLLLPAGYWVAAAVPPSLIALSHFTFVVSGWCLGWIIVGLVWWRQDRREEKR